MREGFVKVVSDERYGEILGVHIIGPRATETIAEAVMAMRLEGTVDDIAHTIHAHPTLAEAMGEAAHAAVDWADTYLGAGAGYELQNYEV